MKNDLFSRLKNILPQGWDWRKWVWILGLLVIGVLLISLGYTFGQRLGAEGPGGIIELILGSTPTPPFREGDPTPVLTPTLVSLPPSLEPWDGVERVTILLIGLDYRDWEADLGPPRSDTMMLLTVDPLAKTAGILSIPRDLWVHIPGFKHGKINTAYYLGEAYHLPGGGPGLAVRTVEQTIGVTINYYAQIDFGSFVRFIDEIGGVEIDVQKRIQIDRLGDEDQIITLKRGVQVLPGEYALAYARTRSTEGGDFDRAQRQQQVVLAIRDRILHFNMLPTLIGNAPTLYAELSTGIQTNLELEDAIKLATLALQIPEENIRHGVINEEHVLFGFSPDNLSILIPLPDKIRTLRDEIFATAGPLSPLTPGSTLERMQAESARIMIQNISGTPGLGPRTADYLNGQGANIVSTVDSGPYSAYVTIIDYTGNPYTVKYLVELMNISNYYIIFNYDPYHEYDVEVRLGSEWANNNPMP